VLRALKYLLIAATVLIGTAMALFSWSYHSDQQKFRAARNDCERGCIQDSGGIDSCRKICVDHPNRYP